MKPAEVVFSDMFITDSHSTEVLQPGVQPFDLPSAFVSSQLASILCGRFDTICTMGSNQFDPFPAQVLVQRIAVVGSITDQALRLCQDKSRCESCVHKGDFIWRSTFNVNGDRKTSAVCQRHDLRTFTALGLSHSPAPFFATTKKPSMKHSDRSNSPRSFRSMASVCRIFSSTPARRHSWKRRWQVAGEGYRSGRSCQAAPVRKTQRMPFSTSRLPTLGLPFPSSRGRFAGISGFRISHCSSVMSIGLAPLPSLTNSAPLASCPSSPSFIRFCMPHFRHLASGAGTGLYGPRDAGDRCLIALALAEANTFLLNTSFLTLLSLLKRQQGRFAKSPLLELFQFLPYLEHLHQFHCQVQVSS